MGKLAEYQAKRDEVVASAQEILARLDGETPEGDDADKLRSLNEEYASLEESIKDASEFDGMAQTFGRAAEESSKTRQEQRPPLYGESNADVIKTIEAALMTPGEAFVRSDQYKEWTSRFPNGPADGIIAHSGSVDVGELRELIGLRTSTEKLRGELTPVKLRDLLTSDVASAGTLVQSLRRGLIEPGLVRPLTIRDLLTVIPVSTDTIEWVREESRESNAAIVAEAAALTGSTGTKPQGKLTYKLVTDVVHTIAEWVPASKRIISDAGQLRGLIDSYLTYDLGLALEDQIMDGAGGGTEFDGILNQSLANTQSGADNQLDDLRQAKRKVLVNGRTVPNGIVMNPEDAATIDTLKSGAGTVGDGGGLYYGQSPFSYTGNPRIWGMPVVESEAVPQGTAVVGDFRRAVLYDREETNISVGTADDDFIRNIVRVLAELRAGFAVIRPTAFTIVTGW